jgi:hypothetical protein
VKAAGFREAPVKTLPFAASDCIVLAKSAFFDLHGAEEEEEEADLRSELRTACAALRGEFVLVCFVCVLGGLSAARYLKFSSL